MKLVGIAHIPEVIKILRESLSNKELEGMEFALATRMRVPGYLYLMSDDRDILLILEPLGSENKAQVHLYSRKRARGKLLVKWVKEALKLIFTNTSYESLLGITPENNKAAVRFNKLFKFKVIGTMEHDSGVKETISMITKAEVIR